MDLRLGDAVDPPSRGASSPEARRDTAQRTKNIRGSQRYEKGKSAASAGVAVHSYRRLHRAKCRTELGCRGMKQQEFVARNTTACRILRISCRGA